jgi:ketosteroid isomerase-like protein
MQRSGRRTVIVIVASTLAFLGTCIQAEGASSSDADEGAIREARVAQNQAIAAQDPDRVASFWTEDVTIRRALGQPVTGQAAYRKLFEPTGSPTSRVIYQREAIKIEVSANWPLAFEEGTWTGHEGSVSGPTLIGGRYSAQWVKREGRWLIRSEVFVALNCAGAGCKYPAVP